MLPMHGSHGSTAASKHLRIVVLAMLLTSGATSAATDSTYHPPTGFNGYTWGFALTSFPKLSLWHANTAGNAHGKDSDITIHCNQNQSTGETCTSSSAQIDRRVEGEGSFALAEYYRRLDKNPWHEAGIDVLTISYLFCARSAGEYISHPIRNHLTLCGSRVIFRSDTLAELANRPNGYVSNYDRILRRFAADYGEPPGYQVHGRIIVQGLEDQSPSGAQPRPQYAMFRWCGLSESAAYERPNCLSTITLEFEATQGYGTILFATAPVYDFAFARHEMGDQRNDLYRLLYSDRLDHLPPRPDVRCTGTRICNPGHEPMSAQELRDFSQ
jgi:hypothetical protein